MTRDDHTLPIGHIVEHTIDGFSIVVKSGPDTGKRVTASNTELTIGTEPSNDLVLADPRVSRHHCSISATNKGFLLRDHGSKNGTWVGGMRIESGYVFDGVGIEVGHTSLALQRDRAIREPLSTEPSFGNVLGSSEAMRRIFAILTRIAASDSSVLVEGETGTGKGALALAIHQRSKRASGPFVVLDCTAIPPTLVESELFGHVAGAFTGATRDRQGAFEVAKGGTIFIDEIGELPIDIQPKLLRALEERTVKPVGGTRRIDLDVRVVAATNRDLRADVNAGSFRADLFYRLNIVRLHVPPLRERRDDIILLAKHFYEELAPGRAMSPALMAWLVRKDWPGNVRELRGAIERALLLEDLGLETLEGPSSIRAPRPAPFGAAEGAPAEARRFDPTVPFRDAKSDATTTWERWYVAELMRHAGGNLSKASRLVQMDRSYLRALLKKHGTVPDAAVADEE
ncbi:MAG: sigma 54-interacting transcriptional regulator [Polyangiaceae bacterium]|nr:sigma 54-interacting transcriptional regulator [Polyangiaceae bacterium]